MDRREGDDDELYPAAPVPAHERQWRHPSEMGQQAWTASEPPLTIGRGLSAATGVVGGLLALAVLWTMLPTHAGRSAGVSVRSTVANTAGFSGSSAPLGSPDPTDAPTTPPTTERVTVPPTTEPQAVVAPSTDPPEPTPLPTYAVQQQGMTVPLGAVAVAVNDGSLVITTAGAVDTGDVVDLALPDGGTEQARVLLVDQRSGLAVLAHDTPSVSSFRVASSVQPGETVSFYGANRVTAVVAADGTIDTSGLDVAAGGPLPEGTPVVNQKGELVALCSHSATGPLLVSLTALDALSRALAAGAANSVWVGVAFGNDASRGLVVEMLDPSGPAADAGVKVGDLIVSADGTKVADTTQLGSVLAGHSPGDTVELVVQRDGSPLTIAVVLGVPRASL